MTTNSCFFTPWIGRLYGGRGSVLPKKVMVLGASHYCGNRCPDCGDPKAHPECAVFTRDVVRDYLADNYSDTWKATFTTFINSAYGRSTTTDERKQFMDSVVFANFLQRSEGTSADEKHNELFNDPTNVEALKQTIRETRPDVVVVWGSRVWEAIPWDLGFGRAEKVTDDIFRYPFESRSFLLVKLHHPSQGYPAEASHHILAAAGAAAE